MKLKNRDRWGQKKVAVNVYTRVCSCVFINCSINSISYNNHALFMKNQISFILNTIQCTQGISCVLCSTSVYLTFFLLPPFIFTLLSIELFPCSFYCLVTVVLKKKLFISWVKFFFLWFEPVTIDRHFRVIFVRHSTYFMQVSPWVIVMLKRKKLSFGTIITWYYF